MTSEGAVDAERRTSLKIPPPASKAGGFVRINASRTNVDEVSGEGTFELAVCRPAKVGVMGDLKSSKITITGKLLIEPAASPAVDTTIHLVLDKDAKVLITISSLSPKVVPDPMASCYGHVLEQTMSSFIADRTVMRMVHHEPFDDVFTEIGSLLIVG
jgi:hypothetical protein